MEKPQLSGRFKSGLLPRFIVSDTAYSFVRVAVTLTGKEEAAAIDLIELLQEA
jgi:hypothetical protein